ncbi:glutaredoxin family protein [Halopseudomonas phragmitis]|uniref:Glutaredoxin n=2 Tax=Pseudomonadaceae TaxID=135621 RepID=A0A1V0B7W9_9GAMM|nr:MULTISPECIES: glutaredoxin family protein [Pseudomonadaceae]AQZ96028.1 glutaredoxin [Halopseudomonas phragmitis]RHW20864.1 glutaredoxin family protein [Pseudomonas jilinensis]
MTQLPPVTLYGTLACHLCEAAMQILQPLIADGLRVSEVDISDSDELMQRYQLRIPVLQRQDSGAELDFPFDLAQVMDWLGDVLSEGR